MLRLVALLLVASTAVTLALRIAAQPSGSEPAIAPPVTAAPVEPPPVPLAVGQAAPRFELLDQDGRRVSVGGPSATWTALTFYRRAATPW